MRVLVPRVPVTKVLVRRLVRRDEVRVEAGENSDEAKAEKREKQHDHREGRFADGFEVPRLGVVG